MKILILSTGNGPLPLMSIEDRFPGISIHKAGSISECMEGLSSESFSGLITYLPLQESLSLVRGVKASGHDVPVLAVIDTDTKNAASELYGAGAFECIIADDRLPDNICHALRRASERAQLARTVRKLTGELYQSEKKAMIGRLVAGVTHELNNPMTGIIGYSELVMMEQLEPRVSDFMSKVYDSAQRCRKIINNLLAFSRGHSLHAGPVDINELIKDTVTLRLYDLRVNNIEVLQELSEGLPLLNVDSHQMQQVFLNLIVNAEHSLQAKGRGRITIRTFYSEEGDSGNLNVVVSDDGPGIKEEYLDMIFKPFFTTKGPGKRAGLGLSICKGIIDDYNGKIIVESTPGEGAVFTVKIPVKKPAVTEADVPDGKKVLLVDDERAILEVMSEALQENGYSVDTAFGGEEALEMIKKCDYDLVVSDIRMQKGDGRYLYDQLKNFKPEMASRMLFITGDVTAPEAIDLAKLKTNGCLIKPFTVDDFMKACCECLSLPGTGL